MTAAFTCHARNTCRNGFRVDIVFFAAVLAGNLQDSRFGRGGILRFNRAKSDGVSTGFAFGAGDPAWNLFWVHTVGFFAFRTGDLHGNNL